MDWNRLLPSMENVRSIVRPLIMLSGWAVALILVFSDMDVRKLVIGAVILAVGDWIGGRKK